MKKNEILGRIKEVLGVLCMDVDNFDEVFGKKFDRKFELYSDCYPYKVGIARAMLEYILDNNCTDDKFTFNEICEKAEQTEERKWIKAKDNAREEVREIILEKYGDDLDEADSPEEIVVNYSKKHNLFFTEAGHIV